MGAVGKMSQSSDRPSKLNILHSNISNWKKKVKSVESTPSHCKETRWQIEHYPTCQIIHETDLKKTLSNIDNFIGNGYWRSVWGIGNTEEGKREAVIKIMQTKHEFSFRNFERHRRDSMTMEVLSDNPYVVDEYGFCGNSVLTEFVGSDLTKIVQNPLTRSRRSAEWKQRHEHHKYYPPVKNFTIVKKLDLALDTVHGGKALHTLDGPVFHADVTAKQFLVGEKVKINDFNRCRFRMRNTRDHNNKSYCSVRIPSAPGEQL